MNSAADAGPRRLLVRGVNWLGDAVITIPALQRLREKHPQASISLLTDRKLADLWQGHRLLDAVLTFERGESPWQVGCRLRAGEFDTALVFPSSPRSALEVWAAGIPRRIGYGGPWRRWLLTDIVQGPPGSLRMRKRRTREIKRLVRFSPAARAAADPGESAGSAHQMRHYLRLAGMLGAATEPLAPSLSVTDAETTAARARWLSRGGRVIVGLNPGAAYGEAKRWPPENFAAVAREISRARKDVCWILFGVREERPLCQAVAAMAVAPVLNLAGETTLRELMVLLSQCRLLVTNDSGPMHLAAALGTPVVALFGSTSPELTGPGLPGAGRHTVLRSDAACSPCFRRQCPIDFRCLKQISPAQVAAAIVRLLGEGAA